jgi:hypothetical protein
LLALLAPLGMIGCGGGGTGTISGKVYHEGKPLKGGNITFISAGKPSISTKINEDGSFQTEAIAVGEVKICVDTEAWNPRGKTMGGMNKPPPGQTSPAGAASGSGAEMLKRYTPIPLKYADPEKTPLTYKVTRGSQTYDVQLEGKPDKGMGDMKPK